MRQFRLLCKNKFFSEKKYHSIRRTTEFDLDKETLKIIENTSLHNVKSIIFDYLHDVLLGMRIELKMRRHVGNSIVRSCNFLGFDGLMLPTHLFIFSPFGGAMSFESANVYKFVETTKNRRRRPIHLWSTTDTFPLF